MCSCVESCIVLGTENLLARFYKLRNISNSFLEFLLASRGNNFFLQFCISVKESETTTSSLHDRTIILLKFSLFAIFFSF